VSDGAAAVLVVSERVRRERGLAGLRLVASATSAVDPRRLGLGVVPAMRSVLGHAGVRLAASGVGLAAGGVGLAGGLAVVEFTEAFAGQALACLDAVGIAEQDANRDGGAIALGHPWGASGAVLVVRLFSQLVRAGRSGFGLTALSAGGGLGVAALWESVGP
jgi:acetyl-CoA C-acetyltransferase